MTLRLLLARALGVPSVRAIRGATTVSANAPDAIASAVRELLHAIGEANELSSTEVVSAIFTVTPDLNTAFPAEAARHAGWQNVPLLCATEIGVAGGLPQCLRVLLHVERSWQGRIPRHVYLREAVRLRPDL